MTQKWRSFDDQPDYNFLRIKTTKDAIDYLYNHLYQKHGKVLFKRALGYLIRAGGLSDIELEDILSADNTVMQSVFVHYLPPTNIFRLPSFLWIRIRNDMYKYLVQKQIDNTIITYFYHRSFQRHDLFYVSQAKSLEINRCSYFAGPVGNYPHLYNQTFVIQSKKLLDKMGGICSLVVDRCLTKQQPYIYNMRRINQLCLGLEFIWCEPCFLYDYHFMFNYLHCYKMSDKFLSDSYFPQIRFLLTQYKTCSNILDKYPKNFPFEIVCRLSYLIDILPEYTYNLFQQCLNNCKLRMLESETQTFYSIMNKYQIGLVNIIDVGYRTLHLLLSDKLLTFRYYAKDWIGKILEYNLPSNKFISFKCGRIYYCFYSTKSILIIGIWDHQLKFDLNFDNLIHLDFIDKEELFVCLQDNQSMNIYNCLDKTLIEEYLFDSPILQCSTIERYMELSIRITLQNGLTHYFIITNPQQQNRFQLIATLDKKLEKENIFLNFEIDVYYSQGQSHIYLYHFQRPENDRLQKIDNLPLLNNLIYRQSFYTNQHESALIWLTNNSILIFHSCQNYFIIPGQYDQLQTKFYQTNRNFIACLNRNQSIIDIYEWKLQEIIHTYRLLVRLAIDQQVSHWTFQIDTEWGIIVYCTLENGELRKYNTTIRNYLLERTTITHSNNSILQNSIDHFEIQNDFVITLDKTKCILNLFTFVDRLSLFMQLRVYNAISQLTMITSYLLLLNSENILFIYSIDSTPQLLYETNEFEDHSVKVYSLGSSFFIIDAELGQLFRIDTEYPFELHNVAYFNFICHSLLSVAVPQQDKLFILSDDHSMLAMWNAHQRTIEFIPVFIDKNIQIREIFVLDMILIFYDNDQRTHLWNIQNQQNIVTLDQQFSKANNNYLYFAKHIENKCLIYDVKKRLSNEIQLEMSCDVFCFTEDGKYLFGISEKESLLLMYQVDNHQLAEKLFIENLSPHIQISKNRLILMNSNNEILLLSIIEADLLSLKRDTVGPSKSCALFENPDWLDCHKDECWTTTNSLCNYQNHQ